MYRVNVKNLKYALLTADTVATNTYSAPVAVADLAKVELKPILAQGQVYGDGVMRSKQSRITGYTLNIDLSSLPLSARAALLGQTVTSGSVEATGQETIPFVAIGFQIEKDDGKSEYFWLYKGRVTPPSDMAEQSEDQIKFSKTALEFTFVPRIKDGKLYKFSDESDGFTGGATFLNTVPVAA